MADNIRNVQNNGYWEAGGTYTFEYKRIRGYTLPAGADKEAFCIGTLSGNKDPLFTSEAVEWLKTHPDDIPGDLFDLGWNTDLGTILYDGSSGPDGNSGVCEITNLDPEFPSEEDTWITVTVLISEDAGDGEYQLFWAEETGDEPYYYDFETYDIKPEPSFDPPLPSGVTLVDGVPTGTPTGESNMITIRKLVAAADNKIWYEDI